MAAPGASPDWLHVLSRERASTTDPEFADHLGALLGVSGPAAPAGPGNDFSTEGCPTPWEIERALYASLATPAAARVFGPLLGRLEATIAEAPPVERLVQGVLSRDWRERWVSRHCLEKATEGLHGLLRLTDAPHWERGPLSWRLIAMVAAQTEAWIAGRLRELLCGRCYVRCARRQARTRSGSFSYYGCRRCGGAWRMMTWPGPVVALLDDQAPAGHDFVGSELWVNWVPKARARGYEGQDAPDFDRVVIRSATEDDVRHFLADIAGEPDRAFVRRCAEARCTIAPGVVLSRNALNALQALFGRVRIERA